MYLVHVHLDPHPGSDLLSEEDATRLAAAAATTSADVIHVAVHGDARSHPVVGVFLRAADIESAEAAAAELWRRAADGHPRLRDWRLRRAEVPLVMPLLEWWEPPAPEN
ncbi:hypothetical protein AB0B01_12125 [Streptomyces sp. NPDC044571]|uniref:hypothetical protein n=1 Tax=Streptomyces sp. NPDC044571 TaxID=3155371 RepID=UPI003407FEE6